MGKMIVMYFYSEKKESDLLLDLKVTLDVLEKHDIHIKKINVLEDKKQAKKYKIQKTPLLIIRQGKKEMRFNELSEGFHKLLHAST